MAVAQEIDKVFAGLWIWHVFDPAVKADLFSTALEIQGVSYLVDPVELRGDALKKLQSGPKVGGVVVTNENHARAAGTFAERFSVPIYFYEAVGKAGPFQRAIDLQDKQKIAPGLTVIAIEGAPAGEIALHYAADGGTMVLGDALINFEPHGFALLPAKYCRNFKLMRRALPKLLDYAFERMLFAHGTPILSGARGKLEHLLARTR